MVRRLLVIAGVVAGIGLLAGWLAYRGDMADARARIAGRSQIIDSPWGAIEYAEVGQGPPVLMIHGSGGGFNQGLAFAQPLAEAGYRVIAPSRFGYLRSDFPAGATPAMQADALAFLMERLGLDRAVIVGGSAGALSAAELALRHPDRCQGLALVVPAAYAPDRPRNASAAPNPAAMAAVRTLLKSDLLFWAASKLAPDVMVRQVLATEPSVVKTAPPAERARVARVLRDILPVSARAEGLLMDGATAGAPAPQALDTLACPLLAVSVRDDLYGTAAAAAHAARLAPDARLVLYETGGHLWVGHDTELWAEVARFTDEVGAP